MFTIILVLIAAVSVLWSLWSLHKLLKDKKESLEAKKELAKGRVVYHSHATKEESSESSLNSSSSLSE